MSLVLLGTSACHLCEQAQAFLVQANSARALSWQLKDIALDDALVERYGERIPVLLRDDGAELNWPFSLLDVLRFTQ
ncbi:MAG: glutaredoxin family protein [Moraxellaceae bacterium]|nr:glutaredoxin family protein [Moraxellaceae bacterium]MDZ4387221.1 glutaredoxin family protein [Moraxellaceae bacterium]